MKSYTCGCDVQVYTALYPVPHVVNKLMCPTHGAAKETTLQQDVRAIRRAAAELEGERNDYDARGNRVTWES